MMQKNHNTILNGSLLISKPSVVGDPSFSRTIVYVSDYHSQGVVGFIINKTLPYRLNNVVPEIQQDFPLFQGGPVDLESLFFVHNRPDVLTNANHISDNIYWGGDFTKLVQAINELRLKPKDVKFFLGYSGWELEQLEAEVEMGSWLVKNNYPEDKVFNLQENQNIWKEEMKQLGGEYEVWSNAPDDPNLN